MPTVLFGISGSIAAFKGLEVMRLLVADGDIVVPVLSKGGAEFVTRASVEALAGRAAITEIFPKEAHPEIEHIILAREADLLVTCPATADILAKYAVGLADDPLALVALAFGTPHLIAPAMNHRMWENPATLANVATLMDRGCVFVGPEKGVMACGEEGWGRLAPVEEIYGHIRALLGRGGPLSGFRVVVTAGATREPLDDVRFFSNRSSGRMGHALAEAARDMGADVTLVTASEMPAPVAVNVRRVTTASEMREAVLGECEQADAVIMAAAVADFAPSERARGKIKKEDGPPAIKLEHTPDILLELGAGKRQGQVLVGFAAEYGSGGKAEALRKCREKACDFMCLNDISRTDVGFGAGENEIVIVFLDGRERVIPRGAKLQVARGIMEEVARAIESRAQSSD
jgi:phosphopantothenoylcysteine decarboxylase/phosphopantothenate--cysteine ligase